MAQWLQKRDKKENLHCSSCGKYYQNSQFYDWYTRPELSFMGRNYYGIVCTRCAKREIGNKHFNKL